MEPLTLKYTRHAAHAMEERRIAKDWKEAVVREPSLRTSDAKRSRGRAVLPPHTGTWRPGSASCR